MTNLLILALNVRLACRPLRWKRTSVHGIRTSRAVRLFIKIKLLERRHAAAAHECPIISGITSQEPASARRRSPTTVGEKGVARAFTGSCVRCTSAAAITRRPSKGSCGRVRSANAGNKRKQEEGAHARRRSRSASRSGPDDRRRSGGPRCAQGVRFPRDEAHAKERTALGAPQTQRGTVPCEGAGAARRARK